MVVHREQEGDNLSKNGFWQPPCSQIQIVKALESGLYPICAEFFVQVVEPLIYTHYKRPGRSPQGVHYEFFCAILYVLRTGISWRDLLPCFGLWHTVYVRFKRWSENSLFWSLLYQLQQRKKVTVDLSWVKPMAIPFHRYGSGALKKEDRIDRTWS